MTDTRKMLFTTMASLVLCLVSAATTKADNFSFTGSFSADNNTQIFNFTTTSAGIVTFRTWSYAGGTNAAGQNIARGGFDPNLALFNTTTGFLLIQNNNGTVAQVALDPPTGQRYDSFQLINLPAGSYTLVLTQFGNAPIGPKLINGFNQENSGNFTGPRDVRCVSGQFVDPSGVFPGNCRDGHWAVDILNVSSAQAVSTPSAVPEPASMVLVGSGLAGLAIKLRRRRSKKS
jgi:hypothetical protein